MRLPAWIDYINSSSYSPDAIPGSLIDGALSCLQLESSDDVLTMLRDKILQIRRLNKDSTLRTQKKQRMDRAKALATSPELRCELAELNSLRDWLAAKLHAKSDSKTIARVSVAAAKEYLDKIHERIKHMTTTSLVTPVASPAVDVAAPQTANPISASSPSPPPAASPLNNIAAIVPPKPRDSPPARMESSLLEDDDIAEQPSKSAKKSRHKRLTITATATDAPDVSKKRRGIRKD